MYKGQGDGIFVQKLNILNTSLCLMLNTSLCLSKYLGLTFNKIYLAVSELSVPRFRNTCIKLIVASATKLKQHEHKQEREKEHPRDTTVFKGERLKLFLPSF